MAADKSPRAKTQTLSLRLDPKTRFVLEFIAKLRRQSITMVVEEAIRRPGGQVRVGSEQEEARTWLDYWDVSDGVRSMNLLADEAVPSDYADDELKEFLNMHIYFFSERGELDDPNRINVDILWPNINHYLDTWQETKRSDPYQVGREMASALRDAGITPPDWPRGTKPLPKTTPNSTEPSSTDFDDEIPF